MFTIPDLPLLKMCLDDPSKPIGARMRASYHLKQIYQLSSTTAATKNEVVSSLTSNLSVKEHGKLMRHEFGYVLGQLKDPQAIPALCAQIDDVAEDCICRHECAEALGAICSSTTPADLLELAMDTLKRNESNPANPVEVRETCTIAINFVSWKSTPASSDESTAPMACACMLSSFDSTDPAPPHPSHQDLSFTEIGAILRDTGTPLFERYRAMFSLRNKGGPDAAHELGKALVGDTTSALFRHEVAFVLGQLQAVEGLDYLARSLRRVDEHEFVRHESAEAIGAIEGAWEKSEAILREFLQDSDLTVRQSCEVALDAADYFGLSGVPAQQMSESESEFEPSVFSFTSVKGTTKSHLNIKEKHNMVCPL
mmetsp:Transcript_25949/g.51710  ORF Transcript_25949/g.51710 Transcript_25949/m.51710 type:complete len:369 (+) Transcript_25949:159-1265(+)